MVTTAAVRIEEGKVTLTVAADTVVKVVRDGGVAESEGAPDWEAVVEASKHGELEQEFCRRAVERGWLVERARSSGPHADDVSIYPALGQPRVRICAFYGPSARVAFHNRVHQSDAAGRPGVAPVFDYKGQPNERFTGLRIRLRSPQDVDTAIALATLVYERIVA